MPLRDLNKQTVIDLISSRLQAELGALLVSAKAAHDAATHEESKAEDQYDTRGLEASYLAGAQALRAEMLQSQIGALRRLPTRDLTPGEGIIPGALIEIEAEGDGKKALYYLVDDGGGISIPFAGRSIQVITPKAPLGEALLGRRPGEIIEYEVRDDSRSARITAVR